jgi:hypothetical protein
LMSEDIPPEPFAPVMAISLTPELSPLGGLV